METHKPPSNDQGWVEVINRLNAFAEDQISLYNWFRGKDALPQGYTSEDFTQEAILAYLAEPSMYDPEKGEFLAFLKYYILRRLVFNLSSSAENKKSRDVFRLDSIDEDGVVKYENYLPTELLNVESDLDFEKLTDAIIEQLNGQPLLENIFEGLFINHLKRSEICKKHNITENDYDNGVRRLGTILKTAKLLVK